MRKRNRERASAASKVHARPNRSDIAGTVRAVIGGYARERVYRARDERGRFKSPNQDMQSGQASPNQDGCGRCGGAYPCNGVLWGTHRFER
jgi:hypothetical protein